MKTTDEDSDVFEITDFTTASEWERFIARLEEIIHEWKLLALPAQGPLQKGELANGEWETQEDTVQFADFRFTITRHFLKREASAAGCDTPDKEGAREVTEAPKTDHGEDSAIPTMWLDLSSVDNDFPSRAHCLVRWYGLRDFIILAPDADFDAITSESKSNILLSSIAIAVHNTTCQVPMFIQVHKQWRRLYFGYQETLGFRTSFEMVQLKHTPPQYSHLAGLLDVFKAKLNSPITPYPPITVSVRLTYVLQEWPHYYWPQSFPDLDSVMGGEVGCTEFGDLPFGACEDPVRIDIQRNMSRATARYGSRSRQVVAGHSELHLSTTWPSLSEEMIVDTDVYSDLDPLQAPDWSVRVRVTENPQCLLEDYLDEFVLLFHRRESTTQLLGHSVMEDDFSKEADISQALQRLTEPMPYTLPSIGTVVTKATSKLQIKPEEAPIAADLLNEILLFLFPDARDDSDLEKEDKENGKKKLSEKNQELFRQFKSAPMDSLTYRLAVCLCIVNHSYGGLRAVAHLWQEFVLEMRYRWENGYLIPDLEQGSPNLGSSLLHQKLQMLNCCIRHKTMREELMASNPAAYVQSEPETDVLLKAKKSSTSLDEPSSSDDEFYDCDNASVNSSGESSQKKSKIDQSGKDAQSKETDLITPDKAKPSSSSDQSKVKKEQSKIKKSQSEDLISKPGKETSTRKTSVIPTTKTSLSEYDTSFVDSLTHQPEGRLRPCNDGLRLLNDEDVLYIPVTQEPAPMTEDMLEEHAEVLAKLGTSEEGANLRARMQSACLLSDMESFKAANPGAVLGDFVRWYSPRDWVEEEILDEGTGIITKTAQLSQRMQIPGNVWLEVWQSSKPVPVRRQKRLFDDTKEAEKVLHFLSALRPGAVAQKLMPMVLHAALAKLMEQDESEIASVKTAICQQINRATKIMRSSRFDVQRIKGLCHGIGNLEVMITRAQSLKIKFLPDREKEGDIPITPELQEFITNLLEQPETAVAGGSRGPVGATIHNLFASSQKSAYMLPDDDEPESADGRRPSIIASDFPLPAGKEYILRTVVPRPAPWSRPTPQRMFCTVVQDDFRLAGAFSMDTTFQ